AFKVYVSHKYGSRFREFIGGQIDVKSSRKVKQFFEVKAKVVIKNRDPLELIFLVSDKSGEPLFFNIYVEGINLLLTERSEIGALMDRNGGDIKATIKKLNDSF
ncbi:MAG: ABC transporter substrate-binding protein, partial [Paracoccaceae bacterium]|nr:ABC transporter substrate-binding protein [Paracoccaceae bacterium]